MMRGVRGVLDRFGTSAGAHIASANSPRPEAGRATRTGPRRRGLGRTPFLKRTESGADCHV